MLFWMKFLVDFQTCTKFLDHRLRKISMSLALAAIELEQQTLAAKWLLLHNTCGGVWFSETVGSSGSTSTELHGGIHILVIKVEYVAERGKCLVIGGTEPDTSLLDVGERHVGDIIPEDGHIIDYPPQTKIVSESLI